MHNGAHRTLAPLVVQALRSEGLGPPVVVGGIVPDPDVPYLLDEGVAAVLGPGASNDEVIATVRDTAERARAGTAGDLASRPAARTPPRREQTMAAPIHVGILNDMAETVAEAAEVDAGTMHLMGLAIDDLRARGRLDRDVEFVHAAGDGAPVRHRVRGRAGLCRARRAGRPPDRRARHRRQHARGHAARGRTRVPTINWAGTGKGAAVHVPPAGGLARGRRRPCWRATSAARGQRRVAVVFDRSPIGRRYASFFESECDVLGGRAGGAGADRPAGHRCHTRSGDCSRAVEARRSCTSAWG